MGTPGGKLLSPMNLKETLHLPDANATIPMKANLPSMEPAIQAIWDEKAIYHEIQKSREGKPMFVLHDGPPYTNSPIHLGTAMNKILKDFIVKSKTMMGFQCPYIPGFDNHGLPIELAVTKKLNEAKVQYDRSTLIKACREHAQQFIDVQSEQFRRLGVLGLWELPYKTMEFVYEAQLLRVFKRLVENGLIYKGLRPTLWSPTSRTALADTEIVYHDHVSKAIFVRFALREDPNRLFEQFPNLYTIIWTTTPWTIPANLAVAYHPDFEYAVVKVDDAHYVLFEGLVPKVAEQLGWSNYEIVAKFEGVNFEKASFTHPIFDRPSIAVMADYVTTEDGTGVVHTAPSHGREDFITGQKYGLPVPNTVDERGYLTAEAGEFAGTFYKDCDKVIVERLEENGSLLKSYDYSHSYPHAERDGKPVIFRATEQWFISIDPLRPKMLEEIKRVQWIPESGFNRIDSMVRNRPDWCVSRQRPWGVGIPVFYAMPSRTPLLDPEVIEFVAQAVEKEGAGVWFEKPASAFLPAGYAHPETGETEFEKETDTLDVWFDSGCSSICTLEGNVHSEWVNRWPADLYLEGSDQHRGWFNTSLIIGVGLNGRAPYDTVLTHGFVTDEKGIKQSKRLGNVIEPIDACQRHGADVVRYWVASVDYSNDVPCSENILKQFAETYRNVRNALRFLMGNLAGFDPSTPVDLLPIDEWVIEQTDLLVADVVGAYDRYEFNSVITSIHNFCRDLSGFYMDVIKDRMYCDGTDWPTRLSGQKACFEVLTRLVKLVAPVLSHTAEETWTKLHEVVPSLGTLQTIHSQLFDTPTEDRLQEIEGSQLQLKFSTLLMVRSGLNAAFEAYKGTDGIKDSQDVVATISESGENYKVLAGFETAELSTLLRVSWVNLIEGESAVSFARSEFEKCERSRLRRPDVQKVTFAGEEVALSARDRRALGL